MQTTKKARMFIFDPCFGGMTGHWESYCKRLYYELLRRGHEVKVYGEKKYKNEILGDVNFVPLFGHSPLKEIRNAFDLNLQSRYLLEDFNQIDRENFQNGDVFIFHSIFPQSLPAIIQWTKDILSTKKITTTLFFQFPPAEAKAQVSSLLKKFYYKLKRQLPGNQKNDTLDWLDNNNVRFYQSNCAYLAEVVAKGSHILYSSTDVLTKNFSLLFGLPVHYLPMPGPIPDFDAINNKDTYKIKVGYFGHSSLAKGGQFIRYLVEKALVRCPTVEFVLHINPNSETEKYLNHFKSHQYPNTTCYFGHLGQAKLQELMNEVDLIILPYSPSKYSTTPSAIFTDAMPLKKVFVLPHDSWAYREAKKYGAGATGFKKFNHRSIFKSLLEAIENFESLRENSSEAAILFSNEHNIKNYIDMFEVTLRNGIRT